MAIFAVIVDGVVTNRILAESKEVAETLTGSTCIEETSETDTAHIGLRWNGSTFEQYPEID